MKTSYFLYLALIFYITPCLLFGELTNFNIIYLILSTLSLAILINYKKHSKEWPTYVYASLHGISLSIMGISILGLTTKGTIFTLSIGGWGSLIFILSGVPFIVFSRIYREKKKIEYIKQFDGDTILLQRDKKINQILGNLFNS
jgi:hypothetical protein